MPLMLIVLLQLKMGVVRFTAASLPGLTGNDAAAGHAI
jgi:hypothetical protein